MRTFIILLIFWLGLTGISAQNIGVGTLTPDKSAVLDVKSDSLGLLVPRMDNRLMQNIKLPADGLLIYNTDEHCFMYYNGLLQSWTKAHLAEKRMVDNAQIIDADMNTFVSVETNDEVNVSLNNVPYFKLYNNVFGEPIIGINTFSGNIIVGNNSCDSLNSTSGIAGSGNTVIGDGAAASLVSGKKILL